MGEYADAAVEFFSNPDPFHSRSFRRSPVVERWDYAKPGDCIWTKADGERIKFSDMTEKHRTYALRHMARNGEKGWNTPTGRALIACGVHDWVRVELKVPFDTPQYPKLFDTNESKGVPK